MMSVMIIGLILFMVMHLVPTIPGLKGKLTSVLGKKAYKPFYALISLVGFSLLLMGYGDRPVLAIPEWMAPAWGRQLATPFMWVSIVLLVAAYLPSNVKRFTRHPMLWSVAIWSGIHLFLNGDKASILLFGSFLLYSLWSMFSMNLSGAKKSKKKQPLKMDALLVLVGTSVFVGIIFGHKWIAGVALF